MSGRRRRPQSAPEIARRVGLGTVLAVSGLLALRFLTASDGYPAVLAQRRELRDLSREVESLEQRNEALRRTIHALRDDPHAVEKIAREELDLVAPGEVLYLFPDDLEPGEAEQP